jgi:hypothetical protein
MSWTVIKRGEYPTVEFRETCKGIRCDACGQIVPKHYTEEISGPHQGRDGSMFVCKRVYGLAGTGLKHNRCSAGRKMLGY